MTRARTLSLLGNENNFTVTGSNNVGIGSTLPDAKLDVGGDIVVGTAITISSVSGIISATDFYVDGISITGAAGTWATFTSGGEGGISTTKKVKIENGLEVTGISTFSSDLTVAGTLTYEDVTNVDAIGLSTFRAGIHISQSSSPTLRLNLTDSSVSADQTIGRIEFKANDASTDGSQVTGAIESVANAAFTSQGSPSHLVFSTNGVSGPDALAERVRITHAGNVGIGTNNPVYFTEIYNTSTNTYADNAGVNIGPLFLSTINNSATAGQTTTIRLVSSDNGGAQNAVSVIANIQETSSGNNAALAFQVRGADGVKERLRIDSSGHVGIGSDNPQEELDILNNTNGNVTLRVQNINSGSGARAHVSLLSDSSVLDLYATSAAYNGVASWTDSGVLSTGSATSGGLKLNAQSGGVTIQTGTSTRLEIQNGGDVLPGGDNSQDLGATDKRWANIYSADLQLSNEGSANDVDGTWGQYTIQEGENDLFLLNRRNGKTYKFVLQEVD